MMANSQFQKDQLIWFKNEQSDESVKDNSNKPFYAVLPLKFDDQIGFYLEDEWRQAGPQVDT